MNVPPGLEDHKYCELCVLLPKEREIDGDVKLMHEVFNDENNYLSGRRLSTAILRSKLVESFCSISGKEAPLILVGAAIMSPQLLNISSCW